MLSVATLASGSSGNCAVVSDGRVHILLDAGISARQICYRVAGLEDRFRVFDPRVNDFVWLDMYVGDRSGTPYLVDPVSLRPAFWKDVQANLVEV